MVSGAVAAAVLVTGLSAAGQLRGDGCDDKVDLPSGHWQLSGCLPRRNKRGYLLCVLESAVANLRDLCYVHGSVGAIRTDQEDGSV